MAFTAPVTAQYYGGRMAQPYGAYQGRQQVGQQQQQQQMPQAQAGQAAIDLIPIVDIISWCTMAVLDKKFNTRLPMLTWLFNR